MTLSPDPYLILKLFFESIISVNPNPNPGYDLSHPWCYYYVQCLQKYLQFLFQIIGDSLIGNLIYRGKRGLTL